MKTFFCRIKNFFDQEISPAKYVVCLCSLFAGILLLAVLLTLILDPYAYFHTAKWGLKQHYANSYALIPGLLRHEEYDTVLFGSSMAQNYLISDLDTLYDGRSLKATSAGLPGEALDKYLALACRKKSFRHAVVSVDLFAFSKSPAESPRLQYDHLYRDSLLPVKYLLSGDTVNAMFKFLRGNIKLSSKKKVKDMDRDFMFGWHKKTGREIFIAGIRETFRRGLSPEKIRPDTRQAMEDQLFSHIQNNPHRTVDLILPPYHIFFWCSLARHGKLQDYLEFRDHFIARTRAFPNVKLHDFQADESIICNMEFYRDETHFDKEINRLIVKEMRKGSRLIREKSTGFANTRKLRELSERNQDLYRKICQGK